jgi:hypothetical protein
VLVHKLPRVNFELIEELAAYLMEIVDNSQINKMTTRNVGIVFAPTLNIPAPLISFFLTDHTPIFGSPLDEASSPIMDDEFGSDPADAIRSPRKQMFSDLPTPSFAPGQMAQNDHDQPRHHGNPAGMRPPSQFPMASAGGQRDRSRENHTGFIPMQPTYGRNYDPPQAPLPSVSHLAQQGRQQKPTSYETVLDHSYDSHPAQSHHHQQAVQAGYETNLTRGYDPQQLAQAQTRQSYMPPQQSRQQMGYETVTTRGYDPQQIQQVQQYQSAGNGNQTTAQQAFASLNSALRPGSAERGVKSKRRESSMMVMNGGGAFPVMGGDPSRKPKGGLAGLHE